MGIVVASLWYSNVLVKQIADDEREKVTLWAEAIQKKASLVNYTSSLFAKISGEERQKIEVWAEASKRAITSNNEDDISFYIEIIAGNTTIPVIVVDENENIVNHRNFDARKAEDKAYLKAQLEEMKKLHPPIDLDIRISRNHVLKQKLYYKDSQIFSELKKVLDNLIESFISEVVINSASMPVIYTDSSQTNILEYGNLNLKKIKEEPNYLQNTIEEMRLENDPILVSIDGETLNYIFYRDSELLQKLKYYPFAQFIVIGLFLLIAYYLFSQSRKVEQNQVWVGMAKETAHQLGTPLSSLIAWVEYLKLKDVGEETINELSKDIKRLEMITERFSKIGSVPKLESENLTEVVDQTINYLKVRLSKKVIITLNSSGNIYAKFNPALFGWVLENIIKNAVDAMKGEGTIDVNITDQSQYIYVDMVNDGPAIPRAKQKTIFEPGFTTKQRGWGLGLSLVKRIVENYHSGKIFVKQSDDVCTTFRVVLNK